MRGSAFYILTLAFCEAYVLPLSRPKLRLVKLRSEGPIANAEDEQNEANAVDKIVGKIADVFSADNVGGQSAKQLASKFFKVPQARASHILFSVEEHGDEAEVMAASTMSLIAKGAITFEQAAEKLSACTSRDNGGDLGSFKRSAMVPEVSAARSQPVSVPWLLRPSLEAKAKAAPPLCANEASFIHLC